MIWEPHNYAGKIHYCPGGDKSSSLKDEHVVFRGDRGPGNKI